MVLPSLKTVFALIITALLSAGLGYWSHKPETITVEKIVEKVVEKKVADKSVIKSKKVLPDGTVTTKTVFKNVVVAENKKVISKSVSKSESNPTWSLGLMFTEKQVVSVDISRRIIGSFWGSVGWNKGEAVIGIRIER